MNKKTLSNITTLKRGDIIVNKEGRERIVAGFEENRLSLAPWDCKLTYWERSLRTQYEIDGNIQTDGWKLQYKEDILVKNGKKYKVYIVEEII